MTATERLSHRLRPYSSYKDSGIQNVPVIPEHWEIKRNSSLFFHRVERNVDDLQMLSVTQNRGVVRQEELLGQRKDTSPADKSLYKHVMPNDIVYNKMRMWQGAVGISKYEGIVSPAYIVVAPREDSNYAASYIAYQFKSQPFIEEFGRWSHGIADDQNSLRYEDFKGLYTIYPPITEQQAIAAFLDRETARIDELMREQEALLDDLSDKRQATINDLTLAVPSQTALPANWRSMPLKAAVRTLEQGWSPQCENRPADPDLGEWGVLKVGCVNGDAFNTQENKVLPPELTPIPRYALKKDDVLISRANTRDLVGSAARVEQDYPHLLLCDKLYRLRVVDTVLTPDYLVYLLGSPIARAAIEQSASGASASMVNISQGVIRNLVFPIPPVEEQHRILATLRLKLAQIDELREEVRANIEDMRIHRSALITAAVTGKIDVRPETE